jgi:GNAT superfamily N-acetyltransferase
VCDVWGLPSRHSSIGGYIEELTNSDPARLPLHLLALDGDRVVGVATVKDKSSFHARYPHFRHWLSAVYVAADSRHKGVASALCRELIERAKGYGIARLYLATEAHDGGLYAKLGFEPIERIQVDGVDELLMGRDV